MFVAILRKNDKEWAIPGGMVDPGETISMTLKREFTEEALNSLSDSQRYLINQNLIKLNCILVKIILINYFKMDIYYIKVMSMILETQTTLGWKLKVNFRLLELPVREFLLCMNVPKSMINEVFTVI